MAYGDFKDLKRRTFSDKVLRDKAFNIAKNPKYDGYQRGLASMVYKFFDKKSAGSGITNNNNNKLNIQLAKALHKPITRNFKKRTTYSRFKNNIWSAYLADVQLISKFNKGFRFSLCVIDIFSKYSWFVPLKDKKGASIVNAFQKILKESNRKSNRVGVDKGSELYKNSFKKWFKNNDIEMYSTHNEEKSVVAERFIRTSKSKIYKYMTPISKNVYIDLLDDIVNKYGNTYHSTIKIKPVDVKSNTYINFNKEINNKILNLKLVILLEYKT